MRYVLLATLILVACGKAASPLLDAALADGPRRDGVPTPTDASARLTIDFTVENCPTFDSHALTCTGTVPLTIRLVPLTTTVVGRYLWNFGDGTYSTDTTPSHTYAIPDVYTVTVVATDADNDSTTTTRAGFVVAKANGRGAPCDTPSQCDNGLFCLCATSAPCSSGPRLGMCTASCQAGICSDNQVCAGLATATPPVGSEEAWQTALCLPACTKDTDCATGLRCRTLPPGPTGSAWVHGCFADVPADVGQPCMDPTGALRGDLCASGMCADLGTRGLCTMNCDVASCPPGSDCAALVDGRKLCLRPCVGNFACDQDPLLTCVVQGSENFVYRLVNPSSPNAASSYCAPRPCVYDAGCFSPTGVCAAQGAGRYCVRRLD
jgi:PKD repeat protein